MNGSFCSLPLRTTCPLTIFRRSPGPATTRLMKFTSARCGVDFRHTWPAGGCWPHCSVGTIDSDGILYGLMRNAWMPRASPSATATISTSSSSEPEADEPFFTSAVGVIAAVGGRLGGVRLRGGFFQRLRVDGLAGNLIVGGRGGLGRRIVQQTR